MSFPTDRGHIDIHMHREPRMTRRLRAAPGGPSEPSTTADPGGLRWLLCLVCFLSGAATLVIEIAGNRLLAPLFGNGMHTWTALIGVVLVAISVGDYVGGWLVDRAPRLVCLGYLLLAAAGWTLLVPLLHDVLQTPASAAGVIGGPLLVSLVLFAVPACLLAAACPFVVRLLSRSRADLAIGLSAGLVGMLATLGSFVGTILTGFYLLPACGVRTIFLVTGLLVAALGGVVLLACRSRPTAAMPALAVATLGVAPLFHAAPRPEGVLHEQQTFYHDIRVEETTTPLGERVRLLKLDRTDEGGQYVETGGICLGYQHAWRIAEVFCPRLERAAFLGGGGFAMPQQLAKRYPEARVDVVELDPAVIDIGRRFFRLDEFPTIVPVANDARRFLRAAEGRYDLIVGDVYDGERSIPPHLVTTEFFALVKSRLAADGVYLMNIVSPIHGPHAELFRAVLATLRTQFAATDVYAVDPNHTDRPRNVILLASPRNLSVRPGAPADDVIRLLLATRVDPSSYEPLAATALTDDHNPSEYLVARQRSLSPDGP